MKKAASGSDERRLSEVGLGRRVQLILYGLTLLPFIGFIIGTSYSARRHKATRVLGWRLLYLTMFWHSLYLAALCMAVIVVLAD